MDHTINHIPHTSFNLKKANRDRYRREIEDKLSKRRLPSNCQKGENILRTIILKAASRHISSSSGYIGKDERTRHPRLQTTQPTSGGAVTADSGCCANCVKPPRPQQWGPDLPFFWACGPAGWLALLLTKAGDVETNPGPITLNKKVWICDICHKQIHVRKQISIRCNRNEH